jgi:hypothetical protein
MTPASFAESPLVPVLFPSLATSHTRPADGEVRALAIRRVALVPAGEIRRALSRALGGSD